MGRIESFEDFDAYQAARAYVKKVYAWTREKPLAGDFVLRDQMRGALESILSNFAEGYGRQGRKEFIQFLSYANGSLAETRAKLHIMADQGYITSASHEEVQKEAISVGKRIGGLMRYLEGSDLDGAKFSPPPRAKANLKPITSNLKPGRAAGAAIISTLLVLTVLTIMVVAFLQSMRIDRLTARAYLNKARAEMAAQGGLDEGTQVLLKLFENYPDAVTTWERINGTEVTAWYARDESAAPPGPDPKLLDPPVIFRPLISGAVETGFLQKVDSFDLLDSTNSASINNRRLNSGEPWIGRLPDDPNAREIRAPWVDVTGTNGEVTARYAWWIEDESFKVPVNESGDQPRGDATPGASPIDIPLQGILLQLKLAGEKPGATAPLSAYAGMNVDAVAAGLKTLRESVPVYGTFFDPGLLNRLDLNNDSTPDYPRLRQDLAFLAAFQSSALNLSRHGSQRLNLNRVVQNSSDPAVIRRQLDRVIAAIEFHLPAFGQRFYRSGTGAGVNLNATDVTAAHEIIYLQKLAANLRDYIDEDHLPTVVENNAGQTVRVGAPATRAIGFPIGGTTAGDNDVVAVGKEAAPYLQEYALRARLVSLTPASGSATTSNYEFFLDHYFEFWNMSNKDIELNDLGVDPSTGDPSAFIKVYSQPAYDTAGGTLIQEGRDFTIPLKDFVDGSGNPLVFQAGQATILTTDATPSGSLLPNPSAAYRPASPNSYSDINGDSTRRFTGNTRRKSSNRFRINLSPRSTGSTDYQTEVLLGNHLGLIESHTALPMPVSLSINADPGNTNTETYFWRGGSLRGNSSALNQVGDPRTNNEQLRIQRYRSGGDEDQTRYYNNNLGEGPTYVPRNSNFGNAINPFTSTATWADPIVGAYTPAGHAPAVVRDGAMETIGELGHIFDPARGIGPTGISFSRGGGRTLKVGQSDARSTSNPHGLWDGSRTSASREWTAWRLADVFCVQDELQLPGRFNINGILRDDGAGIRALVYGLRFPAAPAGDPRLAGKDLQADALVESLRSRFSTVSPSTLFWERGELSELPAFHRTSANPADNAPALASGANMAEVIDRSREELFRRLSELVATRGSTYSVYVVGQSVQQLPGGGLRVLSTAQVKQTVRLRPVFDPVLNNDFDPASAAEIAARFARPVRYEIEFLP